jgi:hypothetical protein
MCSPRSEISVTAADYRETVHGHPSQQRSTGVGDWRIAPQNNVSRRDRPLITFEDQSEWRFPAKSRKLLSHLPLPSTQADAPVPTIVDSETPLRSFDNALATWDYSQTLNKGLARSRSSRSAVSAIIPVKG